MVGKMSSEDEEMMYCAGLLLELPQLVYMSEFKEAWKQGNWISTKKRSARKIRRAFVDFNCCKSLMPRFGSSSSSSSKCCVCCGSSNKSEKKCGDDVVGKKRKRMNPNPNLDPDSATQTTEFKKPKPTPPTTTKTFMKVRFKLSSPSSSSNGRTEKDSSSSSSGVSSEFPNVGGADGIVAGKKRKKNPIPDTTMELISSPPEKQKSSLKVTFKFSGGHGRHTSIAGVKDSSISSGASNKEVLSEASNAIDSTDKAAQPEPSSSLVLVDNDNATEKEDSNNDDKLMKKPLIPDLNIPITMIEDPLPDPSSVLLASPAVPMQTQDLPHTPTLLQNNNNNVSYYLVSGGLVPAAPTPILQQMNIHAFNASYTDRAAAAKEKRTMRMIKLKQRKMACC